MSRTYLSRSFAALAVACASFANTVASVTTAIVHAIDALSCVIREFVTYVLRSPTTFVALTVGVALFFKPKIASFITRVLERRPDRYVATI